jgi:hypothetical protein
MRLGIVKGYFGISFGFGICPRHRAFAASRLSRDLSGCCADFFPPLLPILRRYSFTGDVASVVISKQFGTGITALQVSGCASTAEPEGCGAAAGSVRIGNDGGHGGAWRTVLVFLFMALAYTMPSRFASERFMEFNCFGENL